MKRKCQFLLRHAEEKHPKVVEDLLARSWQLLETFCPVPGRYWIPYGQCLTGIRDLLDSAWQVLGTFWQCLTVIGDLLASAWQVLETFSASAWQVLETFLASAWSFWRPFGQCLTGIGDRGVIQVTVREQHHWAHFSPFLQILSLAAWRKKSTRK